MRAGGDAEASVAEQHGEVDAGQKPEKKSLPGKRIAGAGN